MSEGTHPLAGQSSLYLRAHSEDPVEWYPWGAEPFERARELDRPVFVSVGYASCHWCHVMQRESFRDAETAEYMNDRFVNVKVDRELRPDVDSVYMTYVQLATGHGGWPMSVFANPDGAPFFGGTYFPPEAARGLASFRDVLESVAESYARDRASVDSAAGAALDVVASAQKPHDKRPLDPRLIAEAARRIIGMEDREHGGIGAAPKFPQLPALMFLLGYGEATGEDLPLDVAEQWMYAMLRSGTYDQAGGGLFRYSTDESWLVPHFEKMLYDNGQLLSAVALLFRLRPSDELAHTAHETAAFLGRDLEAEDGGLHSSLDAETQGVEGGTYVWDFAELQRTLSAGELALAEESLGVTPKGNWEGATILTRSDGRDDRSREVDSVLAKLLEIRRARPQPATVTNRLTDWNALAARGLVEAGAAIGDDELVARGTAIVDWLAASVVRGERVLHAVADVSVEGVDLLADYTALAAAAHAAAGATNRADLAELAGEVMGWALGTFQHEGVVTMAGPDAVLPLTPVQTEDAPTPSGLAMLGETYGALRPADPAGAAYILGQARDVATRAPYMAGHSLAAALSSMPEVDAGRSG
jgi:uncharacterized protein YyaL (SSP411 family)